MIIEFTGHSDDIVLFDVLDWQGKRLARDEVYVDSDEATPFLVQTIGGSRACHVYAHYLGEGCWHFGVALAAEGATLPPWSFRIAAGHEYSTRLIIDTGDDTIDTPRKVEP